MQAGGGLQPLQQSHLLPQLTFGAAKPPRKRSAQEELAGQVFDHLMRLRPPLVDTDTAGFLADRLIDQARASHERLMLV